MRSSYGEPPSHPTQKALRARNSEVIFTQHLPSALSPPTLCGYTLCATVFVTVFAIISYILQYFYLFVKSFSKYLAITERARQIGLFCFTDITYDNF